MPENKKQWSSQQVHLLSKLKQSYPEKQWKKISKQFAKKGFERTQYQCREKWVNSLDPRISHQPWTENQLVILFQEYEIHSSQWAIIQKALPNRTQIKIKNQFYSLVRNLIRFILKFFKSVIGKQSNTSNRIHPRVLQKIYAGQQEFSFLSCAIRDSVKEMGYQFDKIKFLKDIKREQKMFKKLNDVLVKYAENRTQNENRENQEQEQQNNMMNFAQNDPDQQNNEIQVNFSYPQLQQAIKQYQIEPYLKFPKQLNGSVPQINLHNQVNIFPQNLFCFPQGNSELNGYYFIPNMQFSPQMGWISYGGWCQNLN